jgi:DnaJ-domain-containing protein 1
VAPNEEIIGLGKRTDRPRLNTAIPMSQLKLSPTEGFVLSRIDGSVSYDEICQISGIGREQTLEILRKLKQQRVILGPGEKAEAAAPPSPWAQTRPAHFAREPKTPPPMMVTDDMLRKAQEKAGGGSTKDAAEPGSTLERLDDGSIVDPSDLIEGPDISGDTKKRIVRLHRRLRILAAHELLGVPPDADRATVKRAFTAASKELHPDRYFGKNLGTFREKLSQIFARLTEAMQEMEKARKAKKPAP